DGRYTLQARAQVAGELYEFHHLIEEPPADWIVQQLGAGRALGYDPWLHTALDRERYATAAAKAGGRLMACEQNPVDAIWAGQPPAPIAPVVPHPLAYAGRDSRDKCQVLAGGLAAQAIDAVVLTLPDSIAWLLNIRGGDVPHTPLALSFAVLRSDATVDWFVDSDKITDDVRHHLGNRVALHPPQDFLASLDDLGRLQAKVRLDPATAAGAIAVRLAAA